jgi:hypothetical protein
MSAADEKRGERLAAKLQRVLASDLPATWGFAESVLGDRRTVALVMKRTYRITNGRCELAAPAEREVLHEGEMPYDAKLPPPRISPPVFTNDGQILRSRTDVVIQAVAHAYEKDTRKQNVSVRFGKHEREIAVFGDRRGEVDRLGRLRFSEPEPFEAIPVVYNFAYGGFDRAAFARDVDPTREAVEKARPEYKGVRAAKYRYPRNPCGLGYLIELDENAFVGMRIPHLEYPFDPLGPARLAVGSLTRWVRGPLPAGWDWQSQSWFPRSGFLGMIRDVEDRNEVPAEAKRGWVPRDILSSTPIHQDPERPISPDAAQSASPGMSVDDLVPGETFVLRNLHRNKPTYSFQLPSEFPRAKLELRPGQLTDLASHIDSVVVRPGPGEVVIVWSARAEVERQYTLDELRSMRQKVRWALPGKEA